MIRIWAKDLTLEDARKHAQERADRQGAAVLIYQDEKGRVYIRPQWAEAPTEKSKIVETIYPRPKL